MDQQRVMLIIYIFLAILQTGYVQIGGGSGNTYRMFEIRCFFGSCDFEKLTNGMSDVIDHTML